jgi:hypothetical protein
MENVQEYNSIILVDYLQEIDHGLEVEPLGLIGQALATQVFLDDTENFLILELVWLCIPVNLGVLCFMEWKMKEKDTQMIISRDIVSQMKIEQIFNRSLLLNHRSYNYPEKNQNLDTFNSLLNGDKSLHAHPRHRNDQNALKIPQKVCRT